MISILYLFNLNGFVKIRNRSTQTEINIFNDFCNLKNKTKANIKNWENKHEPKNPKQKQTKSKHINKKTQLKVTFHTQMAKSKKLEKIVHVPIPTI